MAQLDTAAEQRAAEAVVRHHAQLSEALDAHAGRLIDAAERADAPQVWQHRQELTTWLRTELLPHAHAEEATLYPAAAARPGGQLLVAGMQDEHRVITGLVAELEAASSPVRAAGAARALVALFATHLAKENELIVPLLVEAHDVSLAGLLAGMHELIGGHAEESGTHGGCGADGCGCGCGGDGAQSAAVEPPVLTIDPRLDVRDIPHDRRHATVLAALGTVPPNGALVLIAPHAPRPLLAEVSARYPGQFDTEWLQAGPDVWQIRLRRTAASG